MTHELKRNLRMGLVPALALGFLSFAASAQAQLADLNVNDLGAPACVGGSTVSETFDPAVAINESILALTDPAGDPLFWELTFSAGSSTPGLVCTPTTTGTGFVTSYACDNGVNISLPAGATDLASVSSNLPVTLTAAAGSGQGTNVFSLTASREANFADTCQMFYEVEILEPSQAFDLIFVLDKSGSMTSSAGASTRWNALVSGVNNFLPFIELAAGGSTPPGSQLGVTFFDGGVNASTTAMFDILDGGGNPTADFNNIATLLNGINPQGSTAMGAGLQDAIGKTPDATRPRVVVLFSDGIQNVDPEVTLDGCGFTAPASDINPPNCPATDGHKIVSIGIGSPSGDYLTTLQNLGSNNRGAHLLTDNGTDFTGPTAVPADIGATFQAAIGAALQDNSPQQILNVGGPVQPAADGTMPNVLPSFQVNRRVEAVALSFAFSDRFETPQLLQLAGGIRVSRNGTDVTNQFVPRVNGNFSGNLTLVSLADTPGGPGIDLEGEYEVSVSRPSEVFKPNLEFRMFAYVEEKRFDVARTSDTTVRRVNDTLDIELTLDWLDAPIETADAVVRVFVPGADMGEVLSKGDPVETSGGEDAASAGVQKYDQLVANDPGFLAELALSPNAVTLTHQADGRYTGSFTLPDTVGAVHLVYDVVAEDAAVYGTIQRHWYETVYARYDSIDMENSAIVSSFENDNVLLTFTPQRPSAKRLGPGHVFGFSVSGAEIAARRDLQNGTYELLLNTTDLDAPITVALDGEDIYSGPAGWGERPARGIFDVLGDLPFWALLLLLLVIILLVLMLVRALRPSGP